MTQGWNKQVVQQAVSTRLDLVPDFKPSGLWVLMKLSRTASSNAGLTGRLDELLSANKK